MTNKKSIVDFIEVFSYSCTNALKEIKRLCKEVCFTDEMLKGLLTGGRQKK
jgi:hypothetical protein|tara:strand:+ start:86 stop:238 length:153 start_codon:yes stop_codon:yes gene_type:complete